jgi:hypothetical protein
MKVRQGFVSNSSASSFCIFGTYLEGKGYEEIEELLDGTSLYYSSGGEYSCGMYVGREFQTIKDDETGKQFKDSTEKLLKEKFGNKTKCSIIKREWHD